ncbi:hypothetical protein GCM10010404_19400 [Nonomuraea africana]|uniref:DUF4352 domain-containing protein n=1 Tax=Nonomuraea africana TaxID=46171 RepID=A0ABR9KT49_9ACTN|nr:hypothetical protein [Nonomuraea africana]MBE1565201.1 hypothetical protein [Nonomuraea africana]
MTATEQRRAAPPRQSRRAPRNGGGSKVLNAVVGLALAGGAIGVQTFMLSGGDLQAPLTYVGAVKEDVDAGRFSARVDSIASARAIDTGDKTIEAGKDQVFLVVQASATVPKEPLHLLPAELLTGDGQRFAATDRIEKTKTLANPWIQPGWWISGPFVFEVPAAALPGARAVFSIPTNMLYGEPLPPEVEVDLGLDDTEARRLFTAPEDVYQLGDKR